MKNEDSQEKRLSDLTTKEFNRLTDAASRKPQSPWMKFMMQSLGYAFFHKSTKIDKWEAWHFCNDAQKIIDGHIKDVRAIKMSVEY